MTTETSPCEININPTVNQTALRRLRVISVIEGISTLALFGIAMPLKYLADLPLAVRIVGSVHGLLFVTLVLMFIMGRVSVPLSAKLTLAGIIGAVIPFGPFVVEVHLRRLGRGGEDQ